MRCVRLCGKKEIGSKGAGIELAGSLQVQNHVNMQRGG